MRIFNASTAGVVAGVFLFGTVGSVSAQELFEAEPPGLQFEREVRSTYIVRLSSDLPAQAVNNRANEIAARFGGRVRSVYTYTINGFAINMSSVALANMVRASGLDIVSVTRDQIVTIAGKTDNPGVAAPPDGKGPKPKDPKDEEPPIESTCGETIPWGVSRVTGVERAETGECSVIDPNFSDPVVPDYSADLSDGSPVPAVCVIDTGVQPNHPDINVVRSWFAPALSREGENDLSGHGTHVAGTIGATANNDEGVVGVAPNARIISVKVLNRRGAGSWTSVLDGLEFIASSSLPGNPLCAVVNMSLGGPVDSTTGPLVEAVRCMAAPTSLSDKLENRPVSCSGYVSTPLGIKFTLAAGNSYKDATTYVPAMSSLGYYVSKDGSVYTAPFNRSQNIHTIAAMDSGDNWAAWSNFGDPVSYIEPGVDIESTWKNDGYKTISGTSMAAPHMAGLLLRKLVNGGDLIVEPDLVTRNDVYGDPVFEDTYDLATD